MFLLQESKPLLTNMEASLLTLLSIYYSLPIYMGKHLHKAVTQSVINVVEALQTFLQSLTGRNNSNRLSKKLFFLFMLDTLDIYCLEITFHCTIYMELLTSQCTMLTFSGCFRNRDSKLTFLTDRHLLGKLLLLIISLAVSMMLTFSLKVCE
jgi:Grap2 and cyclin-D-interacting